MMVPHPLCPECHSEFVEKVQLSPQQETGVAKEQPNTPQHYGLRQDMPIRNALCMNRVLYLTPL